VLVVGAKKKRIRGWKPLPQSRSHKQGWLPQRRSHKLVMRLDKISPRVEAIDISKKPAYAIDKLFFSDSHYSRFMLNQKRMILVMIFFTTKIVDCKRRQLLTDYFCL
jgi:hypothetical protein